MELKTEGEMKAYEAIIEIFKQEDLTAREAARVIEAVSFDLAAARNNAANRARVRDIDIEHQEFPQPSLYA